MEVRCRICLDPSTHKDIFTSKITYNGNKVTCQDVMIKIFSLSVNQNDGLPTKICLKCYVKLSTAYKFKSKADESYVLLLDSILKKDVEKEKKNGINENIITDSQIFIKSENNIHITHSTDNEDTCTNNYDDITISELEVEKKEYEYQSSVEDLENIPLIEFVKKEIPKSQYSPSLKITKSNFGKENNLDSQTECPILLRECEPSQTDLKKDLKLQICDLCGKQVRQLEDHKKRHNIDRKTLTCKFCQKIFISYSGRRKHITTEHNGELYFCDICQKHYKCGNEHKRLIHSKLPKIHECMLCQEKFQTPNQLKFHMTRHTKEKPFECLICAKGFRTQSFLNYHRRRVHDGEKKFVCQYCSKKFFSKAHLDDHIRCHTKEKRYKCKQCDMRFINRTGLNVHELRHIGIKKENCTFCDMKFVNKGSLKTHMITHTKVKNFECKYCGVKFGRSDHRNRHERTAHLNAVRIKQSEIFIKES